MAPLIERKLPELRAWAERRGVESLVVFGSAARDEMTDASDVDLIVTYYPDARVSLIGLARHRFELEDLLGRKVDLATPAMVSDLRVYGGGLDEVTLYEAEGVAVG